MTDVAADRIRAQIELLTKLEAAIRAMREILEPATRGNAVESERRLTDRALEELDSLASKATDLQLWREVRDEIEVRASEGRLAFGADLEAALSSAGIPLSGSFPNYRLWSSVRLDVDPRAGTVKSGRRTWPIGSAEVVVRDLRASARRRASVSPRAPVPEFAKELEAAYRGAATAARSTPGDYVSVGKVYESIKKRMPRGYSRARFGEDLAQLSLTDDTIEFAASRHPRQGIRVPPTDGTLVGSLRLRST